MNRRHNNPHRDDNINRIDFQFSGSATEGYWYHGEPIGFDDLVLKLRADGWSEETLDKLAYYRSRALLEGE